MRHPSIRSRERDGVVYYYCRVRGRTFGLGTNFAEAQRKFSKILGGDVAAPPSIGPTYGELVTLFAEWSESFSSARTREDYVYWLRRFADGGCDVVTPIIDLTPAHVDRFVIGSDLVGTWAHVKIVRVIRRLVKWARRQGYLTNDRLPIDALVMPLKPNSPDAVFTVGQYWWMLRNANRDLRRLLRFMWNTGCRPEEAAKIRRGWVDVKNRAIRFPLSESKRRRARTIIYPRSIDRMVRRSMVGARDGTLFANTRGNRWTAYAIDSAFDRFQRWSPETFPDGCYARMFRYSFATRMIKQGVDLITLSHLMGHADLSMLRKHYAKLGGDLNHLRDAIDRRTSRPSPTTRGESE